MWSSRQASPGLSNGDHEYGSGASHESLYRLDVELAGVEGKKKGKPHRFTQKVYGRHFVSGTILHAISWFGVFTCSIWLLDHSHSFSEFRTVLLSAKCSLDRYWSWERSCALWYRLWYRRSFPRVLYVHVLFTLFWQTT
jgi:hypothetical protein